MHRRGYGGYGGYGGQQQMRRQMDPEASRAMIAQLKVRRTFARTQRREKREKQDSTFHSLRQHTAGYPPLCSIVISPCLNTKKPLKVSKAFMQQP
jgi:hypothetical protein